jgi:hypothetical protein
MSLVRVVNGPGRHRRLFVDERHLVALGLTALDATQAFCDPGARSDEVLI